MTARLVNSSIEVGVDPATAFEVFSEELDYLWIQGLCAPAPFLEESTSAPKPRKPRVGTSPSWPLELDTLRQTPQTRS